MAKSVDHRPFASTRALAVWHDEPVPEPTFRYHPDPIATGSAVREPHICGVCHLPREIRYHGPIYGRQPETLCLHCIHSGQAADALTVFPEPADGIDYLDIVALFGDAYKVPHDVPLPVVEEIIRRTPGFASWQQQSWLYHCADGAAFLGPAGYSELEQHPDALDMIRDELRQHGWPSEEIERFLPGFDRTGEPTAYLFRCLHCGTHLAAWDIG
jgi:uncharacterized protein